MKLNQNQDYATIHGHPVYVYEQGGKYFNGRGEHIDEEGKTITGGKPDPDKVIDTDAVATAEAFLKNLLGGGAMSKAILFQQAEGMHLSWPDVNKAAAKMKVITSQRNKQEFWQLAESA